MLKLAEDDQTVSYLRNAPREIQELARRSTPLPGEVFEVAQKIAMGKWPDLIEPEFTERCAKIFPLIRTSIQLV